MDHTGHFNSENNVDLSQDVLRDKTEHLPNEAPGNGDMPERAHSPNVLVQQGVSAGQSSTPLGTGFANHDVMDWQGNYGFRVVFEDCEDTLKNTTWTYSRKLHKLYVAIRALCPVTFKTDSRPPDGSVILVVPVYKCSQHRLEAVHCCPLHKSRGNGITPMCWVRCDHEQTKYFEDSSNGHRQFLTVPYETFVLQSPLTLIYRFQFMCCTACVGGPNRRPTQVIFILQSPAGVHLGRSVVEVKVCSSPGRHRKRDESAAPYPYSMSRGNSVRVNESPNRRPSESPTPGTSTGRGMGGGFRLTITSKSCCKLLLKINEELKVYDTSKRLECSIEMTAASSESSSE